MQFLTLNGSNGSGGGGLESVLTAQNIHPRVLVRWKGIQKTLELQSRMATSAIPYHTYHVSPNSIIVPVPPLQLRTRKMNTKAVRIARHAEWWIFSLLPTIRQYSGIVLLHTPYANLNLIMSP